MRIILAILGFCIVVSGSNAEDDNKIIDFLSNVKPAENVAAPPFIRDAFAWDKFFLGEGIGAPANALSESYAKNGRADVIANIYENFTTVQTIGLWTIRMSLPLDVVQNEGSLSAFLQKMLPKFPDLLIQKSIEDPSSFSIKSVPSDSDSSPPWSKYITGKIRNGNLTLVTVKVMSAGSSALPSFEFDSNQLWFFEIKPTKAIRVPVD